MKEVHRNDWSEYFAERTVRPCASCHIERENRQLHAKLVKMRNAGRDNAWKATHWDIWQAAVSPGKNLKHALYRAMDESGFLLGVIFAVGGLALYGLFSVAVVVMAAIQEAAK